VNELIQVLGAIVILVAFGGLQFGWLGAYSRFYLVLNVVGSVVLSAVALVESDWGFLLLEAVWAVVSLWSLVQVLRGALPRAAH
jgi:hypothetical protein